MGDGTIEGGAVQLVIAIITIIILVIMVIVGGFVLAGSDYDTSVWSNKTGWGSGLLGIGLIGLFTFGVGFMSGKSAGFAKSLGKIATKII